MVGENSILRKVWTKASGVKVNSRVNRPSCLSVKGKGLSEESGSMKKKMFFEYKEFAHITTFSQVFLKICTKKVI